MDFSPISIYLSLTLAAGGAVGVNSSTIGGVAVIGYSSASGAVEVNYSTVGVAVRY